MVILGGVIVGFIINVRVKWLMVFDVVELVLIVESFGLINMEDIFSFFIKFDKWLFELLVFLIFIWFLVCCIIWNDILVGISCVNLLKIIGDIFWLVCSCLMSIICCLMVFLFFFIFWILVICVLSRDIFCCKYWFCVFWWLIVWLMVCFIN